MSSELHDVEQQLRGCVDVLDRFAAGTEGELRGRADSAAVYLRSLAAQVRTLAKLADQDE